MINLAAAQDHLTEPQAITFGEEMRPFTSSPNVLLLLLLKQVNKIKLR
jgi:hypothetical protein